MVKLYCPKCMDVYTPKSSRHHHTDGAYFGTGFPHMLFMVHPEYRPKRPANQFVPRYNQKFYLTRIGIQVKDIMAACSTTGCFRMSSNFRLDSVSNLTDSWHNLPIISLNFATLIVIYLYYLEFLELITILFNTERKDFV